MSMNSLSEYQTINPFSRLIIAKAKMPGIHYKSEVSSLKSWVSSSESGIHSFEKLWTLNLEPWTLNLKP